MSEIAEVLRGERQVAVVCDDAKVLCDGIPDESIDLILCDPVWQRTEDYQWLAQIAARVLVPGGNCIAECGHLFIKEALDVMSKSLSYVWLLIESHREKKGLGHNFSARIAIKYTPYIWFCKGNSRNRIGESVMDCVESSWRRKELHPWQDTPFLFSNLMVRLCPPGGIILDPFTGSGTVPAVCKTLGRRCIAFEIDPAVAEIARRQAKSAPEMLPGFNNMRLFEEEEEG